MINFTGQTNKRVVNLGNRRSGTSSRNYLEQTRLQRQQRESQRQKDRATLVLQSHIRRYIDLAQHARHFRPEWLAEYGTWPDARLWELWTLKFLFLARWGFPNDTPSGIYEILGLFVNAIQETSFEVTGRLLELTVSSLNIGLATVNSLSAPEETVLLVCRALLMLLHLRLDPLPKKNPYKHILANLSKTLTREGITENLRLTVLDLALSVGERDTYAGFLLFLSNPHVVTTSNRKQLCAVHNIIKEPVPELVALQDLQKVALLENVLALHGKEDDFTFDDYLCIGSILATISFTIRRQEEVDDLGNSPKNFIVVSDQTYENIQVLCSSGYIKLSINHFVNLSADNDVSDLALRIFASLMYILPSSKNLLCMLITITPGSYRWFYTQLKKNTIYQALEDLASRDFLTADNLSKLYTDIPEATQVNFWNTLFTFEELYSYWLIVSNDLETFSSDKLSVDEVSDLMKFLRGLCLTLIFNSANAKLFEGYDKLKDVSISLLNQLHIKNIRLNFLPDNFWSPLDLSFNIDNMIRLITIEEENAADLESDDEENGIDIGSSHGASSFKALSRKPKINTNNDTLARVEVLQKLPFFISFRERVQIFQTLIDNDKKKLYKPSMFPFFNHESSNKLSAEIRRGFILEDAFESFHRAGSNFRNRLSVTFFNKQGVQEDGIDGGGITKEFLTSVVQEAFRPDNEQHLFKETVSDNQLYPNEEVYFQLTKRVDVGEQQLKLLYYKFLGSVIGKCIYENVLIDVSFAPFFLIKCCNSSSAMKNSINDLNSLDKELFVNLMKLINMTPNEIETLDLNFTIDENVGQTNYSFDLAPPNGETVRVTASNRLNYIHLVSNFKLNQSLLIQTKYFLEGLFEIIDPSWLSMFDSSELQMLISGGENDVNIQDWKDNVEYGGFFDDDITVGYFWQVVEEMRPEERFKLIKFVTSVSRAPLLGFGALSPKFGIRNAGKSSERLPTASTCVNLLKLPDYQDKEIIRAKLLYAINMGSGFDLS